jgi:Flp pilus assembly protein TadG
MSGVKSRLHIVTQILRRMRRMGADQRGASAIEFALIVPALFAIYVTTAEVGNALTIYRRASQVASTAADLTAQVKSLSKSDIGDIQAAASSILTPYPTSPLTIVLTSVVADASNNGKVDWSCANQGAAHTAGSSYVVPAGLTEADSSVIVAEVKYRFTPLLGLTSIFSPGSFDMTRKFYTRPRRSAKVAKTDTGC